MNHLGRIIAKVREERGMSQRDLAEAFCHRGVQLTNQAISKWETGMTQPNTTQFLILCQVLGVTDVLHTFAGTKNNSPFAGLNDEGTQKAREYIDLLLHSGLYDDSPDTAPIRELRTLPLYQISVSAGMGQFLDSDHYDLVEVGNEVPISADFGVRIAGDSMQPRFIDGQVVWVRQQEILQNGEIGIFLYSGNAYCKKLSTEQGRVRLISLNPQYSPIEIHEDQDFRVFGKVIG